MKVYITIALVVIAVVWFAIFLDESRQDTVERPVYVTLQAASGNNIVQMFERIGSAADVIKQFPTGQSCLKINGPTAVSIEGIAMKFHLLSCDGVTGYVNSKYVH